MTLVDQVVALETAGWRRAYLITLHLLIGVIGVAFLSIAYKAGLTLEAIKAAIF